MPTSSRIPLAVVSHLYPNAGRPDYGVFVSEQTRALVESGEIVTAVISPVPWAPWPLPQVRPTWKRYAAAEHARTDFGTVPIHFPRYPSFPRKMMRGLSAASAARSVLRSPGLAEQLAKARFLVAHTALLDGHIARILSRRLGVPYAVFVHGEDLYQNVMGMAPAALRRSVHEALADAAVVITVSDVVADGLQAAFPDLPRARVLPNGVDTRLFTPAEREAAAATTSPVADDSRESGPLRLLSAGRLVEGKGHATVLHAVAELAAEGVDVSYTVAGDGPLLGDLRGMARELGIAARVDFGGAYEHESLPDLLREADLFVLPSSPEAFGVVYLESLACGVPVIAANDGGAATIVEDGKDGFLVPPREPEAVEYAIRRFLDADGQTRTAMQSAARCKASTYTWEANARGLASIIEAAVARS